MSVCCAPRSQGNLVDFLLGKSKSSASQIQALIGEYLYEHNIDAPAQQEVAKFAATLHANYDHYSSSRKPKEKAEMRRGLLEEATNVIHAVPDDVKFRLGGSAVVDQMHQAYIEELRDVWATRAIAQLKDHAKKLNKVCTRAALLVAAFHLRIHPLVSALSSRRARGRMCHSFCPLFWLHAGAGRHGHASCDDDA